MSIDLSKCVPNQKVVTRQGEVGIYLGVISEPEYNPYRVKFTKSFGPLIRTYTQEGFLNFECTIDLRDIVEVLSVDWLCNSAPKLTSPSILELQQELDALKSQISDLQKENEILKAQIAGWQVDQCLQKL